MNALTRLRREDGISAVELGVFIPALMLIVTLVTPILQAGLSYMVLSRATAAGIRYASRVDTNAHMSPIGLTRRPTTSEVTSFVQDASTPLTLTSVTVGPEPAGAMPGETITLTASYTVAYGPLAAMANQLKATFFGGGSFVPTTKVITVSARAREE